MWYYFKQQVGIRKSPYQENQENAAVQNLRRAVGICLTILGAFAYTLLGIIIPISIQGTGYSKILSSLSYKTIHSSYDPDGTYCEYQREKLGFYSVYFVTRSGDIKLKPFDSDRTPRWADRDTALKLLAESPKRIVTYRAVGFPLPSFYYQEVFEAPVGGKLAAPALKGAFAVGKYIPNVQNAIPYKPILANLFINTLIYWVFFMVINAAISAVWIRRRMKRGLCICGYPKFEKERRCPECGTLNA